MISYIVEKFPEFANRFRFEVWLEAGQWKIRYPNVDLVNGVLEKLEEGFGPLVRLESTAYFDAVPLRIFAKKWAGEGKLFIAEQGTGHFHDSFLHLFAYLVMPPKIAAANRAKIDFWLRVENHPVLMKNRELQELAQKEIQQWATHFDEVTGRFLEDLANSKTFKQMDSHPFYRNWEDWKKRDVTIDARIEKFLRSMNSQSPIAGLEWRFQQPRISYSGFRLTAEEMDIVRAMPLLAQPVAEPEISQQVSELKKLLLIQ